MGLGQGKGLFQDVQFEHFYGLKIKREEGLKLQERNEVPNGARFWKKQEGPRQNQEHKWGVLS